MIRAAILLTALIAVPAAAQTSPSNAVERFVAAVQSSADFKVGEFASVVKPEDADKLAKIAKCLPSGPRTSGSGSILILWDCSDVPGASSAGTGFTVKDDKIIYLFVAPMKNQMKN